MISDEVYALKYLHDIKKETKNSLTESDSVILKTSIEI